MAILLMLRLGTKLKQYFKRKKGIVISDAATKV
jgi:hypothetical protein